MITDPIKLTQKLIRIESVSGNEHELGDFVFDYLQSAGFKPRRQKVTSLTSNILVQGKNDIQIDGHMDTVPTGKNWKYGQGQIANGKVYGRGACDIKASIATVLSAIAKYPCEVSLSFVVEEENTFRGIKKLAPKKYVIELEPTENRIIYCHKGQLRLKLEAAGKAAHASVPEQGDNAIYKLNDAIKKIINHKFKARHPILGKPTFNIGKVEGGVASNIVPDYAVAYVDRRVLPNENSGDIVETYKELLKPLNVTVDGYFPAAEFPKNSKIIKIMQNILAKYNMNPNPTGVLFTTQLGVMKNVEGLVFGPGSVKQAHQTDEFVELSQLKKAHSVFCELFRMM